MSRKKSKKIRRCTVYGCKGKHDARGLCAYHYNQEPDQKAKVREWNLKHPKGKVA